MLVQLPAIDHAESRKSQEADQRSQTQCPDKIHDEWRRHCRESSPPESFHSQDRQQPAPPKWPSAKPRGAHTACHTESGRFLSPVHGAGRFRRNECSAAETRYVFRVRSSPLKPPRSLCGIFSIPFFHPAMIRRGIDPSPSGKTRTCLLDRPAKVSKVGSWQGGGENRGYGEHRISRLKQLSDIVLNSRLAVERSTPAGAEMPI